MPDSQAARVGLWSARIVFVLVATFGLTLITGFVAPTLTLSFAVALMLAPAFVAMIIAITAVAPAGRRIWGQLGVAFAIVYCVMVTTTYYLQLTVVRQEDGQMAPDVLALLKFTPGSALFALDMLGYGFMAMATLVAAPAFVGPGLNRWLRWWFAAHGLLVIPSILAPLLLGAGAPGSSDFIGSLANIGWSLFFLPLAAMVDVFFARRLTEARQAPFGSSSQVTAASGLD